MMNTQQTLQVGLVAAVVAWCGPDTLFAAQPTSGHDREGIEVLARGPVHEAFAETVLFDPGPGLTVSIAPPAIEELPPPHKLPGANVAWIPGYWAWDDDGGDWRHGYDPIYAHRRWDNRQDHDWERRVQADFQHRHENEEARPPRTFAAQQELLRKGLTEPNQGQVFTKPLDQFRKTQGGPLRFQPLSNDDRQQFGRHGQEVSTWSRRMKSNGSRIVS